MPDACLVFCIIIFFFAILLKLSAKRHGGREEAYTGTKIAAFVINRDSRPDRWNRFISQKGLNGLNIIRLPATEISPNEMLPDSKLTRGELGCFKSHVRVWEKIVKERIPEALVFEDDANLQGVNIITEVEACRSRLPAGWHVAFLGVNYFQKENDVNECFLKQKEGSFGAHAYVITLGGAGKLLQAVGRKGFAMPVDIFLSSGACECRYFLFRGNKVHPFDLSDTDTQRLR
jgi:glycosyl transferase, family 25